MTASMFAMKAIIAALLLLGSTVASMTEQKVRMDFIRAMDRATRQKKSLVDLQRRLVANARPYVRALGNDDDANAAAGDDANVAADDAYVNDDGLDLREYALKYVGCQTINSWSDNIAEDEDFGTVFALNRFVVFRMCPADTCSSYNTYGCEYDFGEYMIPMEDYLAFMQEYHYARYAEYCSTCYECMTGGSNRRRLADDDAAGDDAAGDDAAANDDAAYDAAAQCAYATACSNYEDACTSYNGDDGSGFADYFQCAEFDIGNQVVYLGPHCASDGKSITIGIYNDESCSQYKGAISDLEAYVGLDQSTLLFYYPESCISCNASNGWDLDQYDEDGINDLCEVMYDASAKCNRAIYEQDRYESDNQEATETEVCGFIESLVMNTYDEYGEINLANMYFDMAKWTDYNEYTKVVSPAQIFGLVISILLFLGLSTYAGYLHHKLKKSTLATWRPYEDPHAQLAGRTSRIHSGIMVNRSTSGFSAMA